MCRKECKECPWVTESKHSSAWPSYVKQMTSIGQIENGVHLCHMVSNDTWAYDTEITNKNVCIGSLKANRDK